MTKDIDGYRGADAAAEFEGPADAAHAARVSASRAGQSKLGTLMAGLGNALSAGTIDGNDFALGVGLITAKINRVNAGQEQVTPDQIAEDVTAKLKKSLSAEAVAAITVSSEKARSPK